MQYKRFNKQKEVHETTTTISLKSKSSNYSIFMDQNKWSFVKLYRIINGDLYVYFTIISNILKSRRKQTNSTPLSNLKEFNKFF